jgi:hypothetical protein
MYSYNKFLLLTFTIFLFIYLIIKSEFKDICDSF